MTRLRWQQRFYLPVVGELNDCWELVADPEVPPRGSIIAGFDLRTYATIRRTGKRRWELSILAPTMTLCEISTHRSLKEAKTVGLVTTKFKIAEGETK